MEVQVSLYTSETHNDSLCGHENFQERTWTTQGRIDIKEKAPYMFTGEYTGVIPDTDGLCAKLYSDCNNPEIMFTPSSTASTGARCLRRESTSALDSGWRTASSTPTPSEGTWRATSVLLVRPRRRGRSISR